MIEDLKNQIWGRKRVREDTVRLANSNWQLSAEPRSDFTTLSSPERENSKGCGVQVVWEIGTRSKMRRTENMNGLER